VRLAAAGVLLSVGVLGCAASPAGKSSEPAARSDRIERPLTAEPADAARGRAVVQGRDGNCLLCHAIPETGARFMGDLGPALSGVGARLSAGELRLRLVDSSRLNPDTIMPSYFRTEGLNQVAAEWRGKTILSARQIEDVIAYLLTLR
jgi:sulfur-oxidizing protein SoxX